MSNRKSRRGLTIGVVSAQLGMTRDTLRYYEKLGLLGQVNRTPAGIRRYQDKDLSSLHFIRRARRMNYSLAEISRLLKMRQDPQHARMEVRELTRSKLAEIESQLDDLSILKNELTLLVNLCQASEGGCPILDNLQHTELE